MDKQEHNEKAKVYNNLDFKFLDSTTIISAISVNNYKTKIKTK